MVLPPVGATGKAKDVPLPPLGLLYLANPLKRAGYDLRFVDLSVQRFSEEDYQDLLRWPRFVFIYTYTVSLNHIRKLIGDAKEANPAVSILCGGPFCNETDIHVDGSDVSVYGEPDLVITRLLEALASGSSLESFEAISYVRDGEVIRNAGTHIIDDLDDLDPPSLELCGDVPYGRVYGVRIPGLVAMLTSRGCPFPCTYCTFKGLRYRTRSVEDVIDEMKLRVAEGYRFFVLLDDNFLVDRRRILRLMDRIIEERLNIRMIIQGRVDLSEEDLYRKLRQAGVSLIIYGIESANQDVLDSYHKQQTVAQMKAAIGAAQKVGILSYGHIIIGSPVETRQHFEANKRFFAETPLDLVGIHILGYIYGTPLWDEAFEKGLVEKNELIAYADRRLSRFSYEELQEVKLDLLRTFYSNPRRIVRILLKIFRLYGLGLLPMAMRSFLGGGANRSDMSGMAAARRENIYR